MPQKDSQDKERISDLSDRATAEEVAFTDEALTRHRAVSAFVLKPLAEDGTCGCGCGEQVEQERLKLGLGLTLECARRRERISHTHRRV